MAPLLLVRFFSLVFCFGVPMTSTLSFSKGIPRNFCLLSASADKDLLHCNF
jgi:hypothetical protein